MQTGSLTGAHHKRAKYDGQQSARLQVQATGFVPEEHCLQLPASIARCLTHESVCRERMLPELF